MDGPKLLVLDGGGARVVVGGVEVVVGPIERPPFEVEAIVEEEDRHLVLSAPAVVPETREHPIRVMTALWAEEASPLGHVVVRRGRPHRLLAVVHDLDEEPSVEPRSVRLALEGVWAAAATLGVRSVRLPLLGAVHGVLAPGESAAILRAVLEAAPPRGLERIWLVAPDPEPVLAAL